MKITEAFDQAAQFLFQNVYGSEDENDLIVCVEHKRFIPCRPCMYGEPAKMPYSSNPLDVNLVRIHQEGS